MFPFEGNKYTYSRKDARKDFRFYLFSEVNNEHSFSFFFLLLTHISWNDNNKNNSGMGWGRTSFDCVPGYYWGIKCRCC